ncbi:MAG: hypothetical protein NTV25_10285 [Methanothrix sp.]|nr:hypothetical protein [Methanothrix sp.]
MDCVSVVSLYGLHAIASGLAVAPKELPLIRIMHRDLEKRLAAITNILEALRRTP